MRFSLKIGFNVLANLQSIMVIYDINIDIM